MCITAYSLVMGCIWTSVLMVLMRAMQKGKRTFQYFGVSNLVILYLFCIFRMTVPIELPVTKVVSVGKLYNAVTHFFTKRIIGRVCVGHLFLIIWCCGTVIKLLWMIRDYKSAKRTLCICSMKREGMECELLRMLQDKVGDKRKIRIYRTPFDVPMEMGILHPVILLPDREYKEQNLYYIMKHEYTHILNHDTTVKLLLNLWGCIFWWNPIAYLISTDVEDTLELKCDLKAVGGLKQGEKAAYLSAILDVIQNTAKEGESSNKGYDGERIKKRFLCIVQCSEITEWGKTNYKIRMAAVIIIYIIMFCASYCVVFQSAFEAPAEEVMTEGNVYYLEPENTFLREREGMYEVIYNNQCVGVVEKESAFMLQESGFEIKGEEGR